MSVSVAGAVQLVLLGKPLAELLSNLKGVVVNDLAPGRLLAVDRGSFLPFFDVLLDDFVALPVTDVRDRAALIVSDMTADSHEDRVIVDPTCGFLDGDQFVGLALEHEDTRLNAHEGLECIRMQINAGQDLGISQDPLSHIAETR